MKINRFNENFDEEWDIEEGNREYYAYLKQRGEGCDYTIGCAQTLITITANNFEEAVEKLELTIEEEYSYDEAMLESAIIFECPPRDIDVESIYTKKEERKRLRKKEEKERKEREEFERLRKKFGQK